jgi:hypothetical protein
MFFMGKRLNIFELTIINHLHAIKEA